MLNRVYILFRFSWYL